MADETAELGGTTEDTGALLAALVGALVGAGVLDPGAEVGAEEGADTEECSLGAEETPVADEIPDAVEMPDAVETPDGDDTGDTDAADVAWLVALTALDGSGTVDWPGAVVGRGSIVAVDTACDVCWLCGWLCGALVGPETVAEFEEIPIGRGTMAVVPLLAALLTSEGWEEPVVGSVCCKGGIAFEVTETALVIGPLGEPVVTGRLGEIGSGVTEIVKGPLEEPSEMIGLVTEVKGVAIDPVGETDGTIPELNGRVGLDKMDVGTTVGTPDVTARDDATVCEGKPDVPETMMLEA